MKHRKTEVVGFRADSELLRLIDQARARFDLSRGEWARGAIIAQLHDAERESLLGALNALREEIATFREQASVGDRNLARATYLILTEVGKVAADDAKDLVRSGLKVK